MTSNLAIPVSSADALAFARDAVLKASSVPGFTVTNT
jgi:hypothetical protein